MLLSELTPGLSLVGLEPGIVVTLETVYGATDNAVNVVYRLPNGSPRIRLLTREDEGTFSVATTERPWSFSGDAAAFQLACEAKRMDLAFLFDPMMAVHTSNVQPLPHQITAVYESMLPQQPLRFVLADDPGAGKTIMAGLYIRELMMRADASRILIIAPGSLIEQWRDELFDKFDLRFKIYSAELDSSSPSGDAFSDERCLLVRLDQLSRNEDLQARLCANTWDLAVFDEAHKLSAHFFGNKLEKTARYVMAERVGAVSRHLLLMTATPHNGKEEDYQLFLALLDSDRFYGRFRDGAHKVDTTNLMRRMVKEDLVTFDNRKLFPPRFAYTVNYELSSAEAALYEAVTTYVKDEMNRADQLDGSRRSVVGFALTTLQRRLASSPEAIYQSLKRRRQRLEETLQDLRLGLRGKQVLSTLDVNIEDEEDLDAEALEQASESAVDQASAAQSAEQLAAEIETLLQLESRARDVVGSGLDRKWDELSQLLQHENAMFFPDGRRRKIVIFSEHRDTLNYLERKIGGLLGNPEAVVTIHGGTKRDQRRAVQAKFRSDKDVFVLIGTDAAGEGVNLQFANLMVNYDLPWNPNRLEQRFGRIHRIGQRDACHLWNLVAAETREGAVFARLLQKLQLEKEALDGRVFDILGEIFEGRSLKDLLLDAIRRGESEEMRHWFTKTIDSMFDPQHVLDLLDRNALAQESMPPERLFKVKEEMEAAEARRLQPHYVQAFFTRAFELLGGSMHKREANRFEITRVSPELLERDRQITGRNSRVREPVLKRYDRICFAPEAVQPDDRPNVGRAVLMHPGHPLMLSMNDLVLERYANLLKQGAIFHDPADAGETPSLLFLVTHRVTDGRDQTLSQRLQFVKVTPDGTPAFAGYGPHLDLAPLPDSDRSKFADLLDAPWIKSDQGQLALQHAADTVVGDHFRDVRDRRQTHVDKTLKAVHERLTKEIAYWTDRWLKLKDDVAAGKDVRVNVDNARQRIEEAQARLDRRARELQDERQVHNTAPTLLGVALVIPDGMLRQRRGEGPPGTFSADAAARKRIEMIAMQAVRSHYEAAGWTIQDVSAKNVGWDLTALPPHNHPDMESRHLEVKGRVEGANEITVTYNEVLTGFNQGERFHLAIVLVGERDKVDGPYYVSRPFEKAPGDLEVSQNLHLPKLLARASRELV